MWDHPRACGEKNHALGELAHWLGSPPRVRGKEDSGENPCFGVGITPAYAGKSAKTIADMPGDWDHPRVCREKARLGRFWLSAWGSPLRVRGKAFRVGLAGRILGITPAYAGKRRSAPAPTSKARDHPRVCGEKFYVDEILPGDTGSPPRVRGKERAPLMKPATQRITPAHAGKSATGVTCP